MSIGERVCTGMSGFFFGAALVQFQVASHIKSSDAMIGALILVLSGGLFLWLSFRPEVK